MQLRHRRIPVLLIGLFLFVLGFSPVGLSDIGGLAVPSLVLGELGGLAVPDLRLATGEDQLVETWNLLSQNKFDAARAALPAGSEVPALIAGGFIEFAAGDPERAAHRWRAALRHPDSLSSVEWEGLLFYLRGISNQTHLDGRLLKDYQEILSRQHLPRSLFPESLLIHGVL